MRTLLGVDFSLGFPAGTAAACGLIGLPWQAMWNHLGASIVDDHSNANNRFEVAAGLNESMANGRNDAGASSEGPFWGCPPSKASAHLRATKPLTGVDREWRSVESVLRQQGRRPFSAWQLLGVGAVGSQSLVGIAALDRLRWNLGTRLEVWPFTTGLDVPADAELVVAEVWPSLWPVEVPAGVVKDAAQVESTARRLAALDAAGELDRCFRPEIDAATIDAVVEEEGWVLGVAGQGW